DAARRDMTDPSPSSTDNRDVPRLEAFSPSITIQTRLKDNELYGHVTNGVFYSYFDTVINRWLISAGGLSPANGEIIGLCVESHCRYLAPASYPEDLLAA